jgi:hypothetical protein
MTMGPGPARPIGTAVRAAGTDRLPRIRRLVVSRRRLGPLGRQATFADRLAHPARGAAGRAVQVLQQASPLSADGTVLGVPLGHPGLLCLPSRFQG